jgi:hypothetical protein
MPKKGVFAEQLDDIDDLMPQRPSVSAADELAPIDPTANTPDDQWSETDEGGPSPALVDDVPGPQVTRPRRRRATTSVPTAEVAPHIHRLLRRLTNKERSRDPITARTYAKVVLDAIDAHQEQLATYWRTDAISSQGGGGLFSRRPATPPRRRRHAEPPARVPLTGLNPADGQTLDELVADWNAPSRSALVEQALRFYLKAD